MSEKVPNINQNTTIIDDAVTLFASGLIFDGWTDATVSRELNSIASSFSLAFTDAWTIDNNRWRLKPGDDAHIHMGKLGILKGYIDSVNPSFSAQQRKLSAKGRSLTGDLADCSATGKNEYKDLTLDKIAEKLVEPFGLKIIVKSDVGAAFKKFNIRLGETVAEALDRLARQRNLLVYPSFEGNVVFEKKGSVRATGELRQGVNILGGSSNFDNTNRFSEYIVYGQASGIFGEPEDARNAQGKATDAGIERFRPKVIMSENASDRAEALERAKYEAAIQAAKSSKLTLMTQGWFQPDGKPWDINQIVAIDVPFLGVRRDMLSEKVQYKKSNNGTFTALTFIREDAFDFKKEVSKEKDPFQELGLV